MVLDILYCHQLEIVKLSHIWDDARHFIFSPTGDCQAQSKLGWCWTFYIVTNWRSSSSVTVGMMLDILYCHQLEIVKLSHSWDGAGDFILSPTGEFYAQSQLIWCWTFYVVTNWRLSSTVTVGMVLDILYCHQLEIVKLSHSWDDAGHFILSPTGNCQAQSQLGWCWTFYIVTNWRLSSSVTVGMMLNNSMFMLTKATLICSSAYCTHSPEFLENLV
jgi:hypothetical protein